MPQTTEGSVATPTGLTIDDKARREMAAERLRSEQNLPAGLAAGLLASLAGSVAWAVVTYVTNYQIGWMAVGIGFLVGIAMRKAGRGVDSIFGVSGAALSLAGCMVGNLLAVCIAVSRDQSIPLMELLGRLNFGLVTELMQATFSPMDLLFYGIAAYEGYRLSFRTAS